MPAPAKICASLAALMEGAARRSLAPLRPVGCMRGLGSTAPERHQASGRSQLWNQSQRIRVRLDAHREMTARERQHQLIEAAVANEHELQPAAVDLASLARQREQRRVDDQLLVLVRLTRAGLGKAWTLRGAQLTIEIDRHVADVGCKGEDALDQIPHS